MIWTFKNPEKLYFQKKFTLCDSAPLSDGARDLEQYGNSTSDCIAYHAM